MIDPVWVMNRVMLVVLVIRKMKEGCRTDTYNRPTWTDSQLDLRQSDALSIYKVHCDL